MCKYPSYEVEGITPNSSLSLWLFLQFHDIKKLVKLSKTNGPEASKELLAESTTYLLT
jgi:hypothetical protein